MGLSSFLSMRLHSRPLSRHPGASSAVHIHQNHDGANCASGRSYRRKKIRKFKRQADPPSFDRIAPVDLVRKQSTDRGSSPLNARQGRQFLAHR
jgi:hypothetical protein